MRAGETAMSSMPRRGCQCDALWDVELPAAIRRVVRVGIIVGYLITVPSFNACELVQS